MIIIKNKEFANLFTNTFFMMEEYMIFNGICLIIQNKFTIFEASMSKLVEIDLETANMKILPMSHEKINQFEIYDINNGEIVWGMCNIVNEAVMQWEDATPFRGMRTCQKLSRTVTQALSHYGMSLELTLDYLKVSQYDIPISYEKAIVTLLCS